MLVFDTLSLGVIKLNLKTMAMVLGLGLNATLRLHDPSEQSQSAVITKMSLQLSDYKAQFSVLTTVGSLHQW